MGAIGRVCAVLLAVATASLGVAAAAIQHTVHAAIHGTVHVVPRTGFLLSYACPPTGKCVAVGGTGGPVDATGQYQGPAGRGVVVPVARACLARPHI